ncbi:MAG: hypothetical protein COA47_10160 [Robiginitomaculum sp.]|nr:MAG: hypothetical protein COA47_10160 [Robiginitomaculum sp.]
MNRCQPITTLKNLDAAMAFAKAGIDFVCIPVKNEEHRADLMLMANKIFTELIVDAELRDVIEQARKDHE